MAAPQGWDTAAPKPRRAAPGSPATSRSDFQLSRGLHGRRPSESRATKAAASSRYSCLPSAGLQPTLLAPAPGGGGRRGLRSPGRRAGGAGWLLGFAPYLAVPVCRCSVGTRPESGDGAGRQPGWWFGHELPPAQGLGPQCHHPAWVGLVTPLTWTAPDLGADPHPIDRSSEISAPAPSLLEPAVLKGGGFCSLTGEDETLLRPEELHLHMARQSQSCF